MVKSPSQPCKVRFLILFCITLQAVGVLQVESESLVKDKALVLAEMQAFMQKRQEEDETLNSEIENLKQGLEQ